jgi:hypothetical protein
MTKHLITFGGAAYDELTEKVVRNHKRFGADQFYVYDDKWLTEQPFFSNPEFQYLFNHRGVGNPHGRRGFGWFAWKPFIIRHALDTYCSEGDIVLFIDADTYPIADLTVLYDECSRIGGIMAFAATAGPQPFRNREWNKRDCMIQMGMDEERYLEAPTAVARFMLFQKGAPLVDTFLAEWQYYCLDPVCQTFEPSTLAPEHPGFREHRTEQAIYTNLCHRYGLKLYREACAFGNEHQQDWDLYPQLFIQKDPARPKSLQGSRYRNV